MTALTFVVPVRHPKNARDWPQLKANLAQTVKSISAQAHPDWRGLIVANTGSDLPPLPDRFGVEWVDFAPNVLHDQGRATKQDFLEAFRLDKGRRVLRGMLSARGSRFFMISDDDDFVSARLAGFAAERPQAHGWRIATGWVWGDGGSVVMRHDNFNRVCGTSLVVRADAYGLPERFEDASADYIKSMLGGHYRVPGFLADRGAPLEDLPFDGAVYRIGQAGSHSMTPGIFKKYIFNREALRDPAQVWSHLKALRPLTASMRREFFGER
ncbi:glycosyltransferase family 2 protein [Pseudorhodoferax soli]|uniref:Galactosyl transferase n=1 Tax=Pseudorhodoferax soli TaxID=545864 RepID=A0A368Y6X2_9BURK|nr:glycosyltransferase family 2 protein [Pseudorhodoferax soli]RCW76030.1 hypothetical protein DES41_101634 [Pseudorhodoferax soli]